MINTLLQKVMPPKERVFFDLLLNSAEICHHNSQIFSSAVHRTHDGHQGDTEQATPRQLKRDSDALAKKILAKVNASLITAIDREDIQAVNTLLNRICQKISRAAVNLQVYELQDYPICLVKQSNTLLKATQHLLMVMQDFSKCKDIRKITENNGVMKQIEREGDDILHEAMKDVFSGKYDPLLVIKLRDIYHSVEKALDLCFEVSDVTLHVALKLQ